MAEKNLIKETLLNLLKYHQQQHNFNQQQLYFVINTIAQLDRKQLTFQQQLSNAIKKLQQPQHNHSQQSSLKNRFNSYELEWIMNWIISTYYTHLKLFTQYQHQIIHSRQDQQQGHKMMRQQQNRRNDFIQLLVDLPVFVQPLQKAKLVRQGAAKIYPNGQQQQ